MSTGGTIWDDPNSQVVREDASASWEEGTGSGGNPDPPLAVTDAPVAAMAPSGGYADQTKDELLELGRARGISPMNANMTKDEVIAALESAD